MAKGYSKDLRERAVAMVEEGESRREVARLRKRTSNGCSIPWQRSPI
jgi:hypothetical protein